MPVCKMCGVQMAKKAKEYECPDCSMKMPAEAAKKAAPKAKSKAKRRR